MYDNIYVIILVGVVWYTIFLALALVCIHSLTRKREKRYQAAIEDVVTELKELIIEEDIDMNLTELLTYKPTQKDYDKVLDLLVKLAQRRFEEYKFLLAKSPDETKDTNFLQIVSNWSEDPELHKEIFKHAVDTNLDMQELQKQFAYLVAIGGVIDLGSEVTVIVDDNTGNPPTGVSPINSGLEGGEIAFIISFVKDENYEEWKKNTFPEPKEEETNE